MTYLDPRELNDNQTPVSGESTAEPDPVNDEAVPSKRKRVRRVVELNSCLCGMVVDSSSEDTVRCKHIGCETQWVSTDFALI